MAKAKIAYLLGACCCGVVSLALIITSFSTNNWTTATGHPTDDSASNDVSTVNHGLFTGTLERKIVGAFQTYTIYATCSIGDNVCIWSCMSTEEERQNELSNLYTTGTASFACSPSKSYGGKLKAVKTIDSNNFMQAGLWLSTIIFLAISMAMNLIAVGFNVCNIISNPIETYASPISICIYYAVAACSCLLTLILWGAEFGEYSSNNIAILDTLVNPIRSDAQLGWSYFLLIPSELGQLVAIGLIYFRHYTINKKEADQVIKGDDSNNDASGFMY